MLTIITCGDGYAGEAHIRAVLEGPTLAVPAPDLFIIFEKKLKEPIGQAPVKTEDFIEWYKQYLVLVKALCDEYKVAFDEDDSKYPVTDCFIAYLIKEFGLSHVHYDEAFTEG